MRAEYLATTTERLSLRVGVRSPSMRLKSTGRMANFWTCCALEAVKGKGKRQDEKERLEKPRGEKVYVCMCVYIVTV